MNRKEYNQCVDDFSDSLYRFILKTCGDMDEAKDIVQESYTKLWEKHLNVDFLKAKSYLFTSAYRTFIDAYRKKGRSEMISDNHLKLAFHEKQYSDLGEVLETALLQIPEVQRSCVLLRDYEGYNYSEIGEILNLNESQVKVYIFRARKKLQEYLKAIDFII